MRIKEKFDLRLKNKVISSFDSVYRTLFGRGGYSSIRPENLDQDVLPSLISSPIHLNDEVCIHSDLIRYERKILGMLVSGLLKEYIRARRLSKHEREILEGFYNHSSCYPDIDNGEGKERETYLAEIRTNAQIAWEAGINYINQWASYKSMNWHAKPKSRARIRKVRTRKVRT